MLFSSFVFVIFLAIVLPLYYYDRLAAIRDRSVVHEQ